jgi:uncharacterized NAD-dependent epimerase/dehydratase family protein
MRPPPKARRLCILAEGHFEPDHAKTATGVIRYGRDPVVAVIDSTRAGMDPEQLIGAGRGIPIVNDVRAAVAYQPDTLLLGIAPIGGQLPEAWRWQILGAIEMGWDVVNGLHFFLQDDPELHTAAERRGVVLWDVREPLPEHQAVAEGLAHLPGSTVVLMVGSDCSVGKMTVAIELNRQARARGWNSGFVATGQTGIMVAGEGVPLDRVIGDFMPGAMEREVVASAERHDFVFVEGQGSIIHPAYSPVTLALVHGCQPDLMVLCHLPSRTVIRGYSTPIPSLARLAEIYEETAGWIKPARVIGVSLNTFGLSDTIARALNNTLSRDTGLPVTDVVRYGAGELLDEIEAAVAKG